MTIEEAIDHAEATTPMSDEELRESLGLTIPSSDPCYGCSSLRCPGEGGCIPYKKFHGIPLSEDEELLERQYKVAYAAIKLGLFDHNSFVNFVNCGCVRE